MEILWIDDVSTESGWKGIVYRYRIDNTKYYKINTTWIPKKCAKSLESAIDWLQDYPMDLAERSRLWRLCERLESSTRLPQDIRVMIEQELALEAL